jgi:hypothetical protein
VQTWTLPLITHKLFHMTPYFYQLDTAAHDVIRSAGQKLLLLSDLNTSNEDSYRAQLHSHIELQTSVYTPSNRSGDGDLRLANLRSKIEIKFANADAVTPWLDGKGLQQRQPPLNKILEDLVTLHSSTNFFLLAVQLRTDWTGAGMDSYPFPEDCLRIANVTNTADPVAWFDDKAGQLKSFDLCDPQASWFGPGIYFPACDVSATRVSTPGGQGTFLKWRDGYRIERRSILRIADSRDEAGQYILAEVFGGAEISRYMFLWTALDPQRVKCDEQPIDAVTIDYHGVKRSFNSFTVALKHHAEVKGVNIADGPIVLYDLRRSVAKRN